MTRDTEGWSKVDVLLLLLAVRRMQEAGYPISHEFVKSLLYAHLNTVIAALADSIQADMERAAKERLGKDVDRGW